MSSGPQVIQIQLCGRSLNHSHPSRKLMLRLSASEKREKKFCKISITFSYNRQYINSCHNLCVVVWGMVNTGQPLSDLIGHYIRKWSYPPIPPLSPPCIQFRQCFALPNCLILFIKTAQKIVYGVLHKMIREILVEQACLRGYSRKVRLVALRKRERKKKVLEDYKNSL